MLAPESTYTLITPTLFQRRPRDNQPAHWAAVQLTKNGSPVTGSIPPEQFAQLEPGLNQVTLGLFTQLPQTGPDQHAVLVRGTPPQREQQIGTVFRIPDSETIWIVPPKVSAAVRAALLGEPPPKPELPAAEPTALVTPGSESAHENPVPAESPYAAPEIVVPSTETTGAFDFSQAGPRVNDLLQIIKWYRDSEHSKPGAAHDKARNFVLRAVESHNWSEEYQNILQPNAVYLDSQRRKLQAQSSKQRSVAHIRDEVVQAFISANSAAVCKAALATQGITFPQLGRKDTMASKGMTDQLGEVLFTVLKTAFMWYHNQREQIITASQNDHRSV